MENVGTFLYAYEELLLILFISSIFVTFKIGKFGMLPGHTENFQEPFRDSAVDIRNIAVSFYSGIFSYAGWNYVIEPDTWFIKSFMLP